MDTVHGHGHSSATPSSPEIFVMVEDYSTATTRGTSWRIFSRCWFVDLPELPVPVDKVPPSPCAWFSRNDTWYSVAIYMGSGNISRKRARLGNKKFAGEDVDTVGFSYRTIRLRGVFIEVRRRELRIKSTVLTRTTITLPLRLVNRGGNWPITARVKCGRERHTSLSLFLLTLFFTGQ